MPRQGGYARPGKKFVPKLHVNKQGGRWIKTPILRRNGGQPRGVGSVENSSEEHGKIRKLSKPHHKVIDSIY